MKKLVLLFASVCLAVAILAENKLALIVSNGQNEEAAVFLSDQPVLTIANNNLVITPATGTAIQLPLTTSMTYRVEMRDDPSGTDEPQRDFLPPTMGWSSWNTYHCDISQALIKSQADAAVAGANSFKDAGYVYINIDDCFQNNRDASGNLQINTTLFPDMRGLVDYIHGLGLKAGIYSDAGTRTCANRWQTHANAAGGATAGLYGHDAADCQLYFETLDFDFIKVDYCGAEIINGVSQQPRYTEISNAIKAAATAAGKQVAFNMCCWRFPGTWAAGVADSWRTTGDIVSKWSNNPNADITTDAMKGVKEIIKENLYLSAYCGGGHYNDMDMLEVGVTRDGTLSNTESETHFAMWCIMSSPLLIGCDLTSISDENRSLLCNEELIALNQDPLGLQAYVAKRMTGGTGAYVDAYVLVKDVETLHGTKRAVAFCNLTDAAVNMAIDFADIDLGGSVAIRDLLAKSDVGTRTDSYSVNVPAHGTKIYTFTAEQRLARRRYEAETAWLTHYNEVGDHTHMALFTEIDGATSSGGVHVTGLGQDADNDLQWRNVYVSEAGEYAVAFSLKGNGTVNVSVNGGAAQTVTSSKASWNEVRTTLTLNAGNNIVRLNNATAAMPDVDYMRFVEANEPEPEPEPEPASWDLNAGYTLKSSSSQKYLTTEQGAADTDDDPVTGQKAHPYLMETTAEEFRFAGNDDEGWTIQSISSQRYIGHQNFTHWSTNNHADKWDFTAVEDPVGTYHINRHGQLKGLSEDNDKVYQAADDNETNKIEFIITKTSLKVTIEYYNGENKVGDYTADDSYVAIGASVQTLAAAHIPAGYAAGAATTYPNVADGTYTYRVNVAPTDPNEENLGKICCTISPSSNAALFVTTTEVDENNSENPPKTYTLQSTAEYFELKGDATNGWKFKSTDNGKWIGQGSSTGYRTGNGDGTYWNVQNYEHTWVIADIENSDAKRIWRYGSTDKGLGFDDTTPAAGTKLYSDKGTDKYNSWLINKYVYSKIEYYVNDAKVGQHYGYLALGAAMADLVENFKPEGYDGYELTSVQATVTADCSIYRVNMTPPVQYITLNYVNVRTGAKTTTTAQQPEVGASILGLGTTPADYAAPTYYTRKATPASVFTEGEMEYTIYYNEPDYAITGGQGNCNNTNNRTQSFDVTAGSAAAVTIGDMQTAFNQALYWNKTDVVVTCNAGETITIDNWRGSKITGMMAFIYLDTDGDGFSCTPDNDAHTVSGDLMTWTTYSFQSSPALYYKPDGTSNDGWTNTLDQARSFTAPTTPGVYRMRYKVDWNNIDPAGASSIKDNGGVIVDFLLEVQPAPISMDEFKYYQLRAGNNVKVLYAEPNHSAAGDKKANTDSRDIKIGTDATASLISTLFQFASAGNNSYAIRHANSDYWFADLSMVSNGAVVNLVNDKPTGGVCLYNEGENKISIQSAANEQRYLNWSDATNAKAVDASPADTDAALWLIKEVKQIPVKVNGQAKWATICLPMPVALSDDEANAKCELYYVPTSNYQSEGRIKLTQFTGSIIPAETPLLVLNTTKEGTDDITFTFDIVTEAGTALTDNVLSGTTARCTNVGTYYGFANKTAGVGFYRSSETLTAVPANKAYLLEEDVTPAPSGTRSEVLRFGFDDDVATGIERIEQWAEQEYYDLNGMRVMFPRNGVYVTKDGTKVLVR